MCPLCIGTAAAWIVSSGTSAGGVAALILRRRGRRNRGERPAATLLRKPIGAP
jgi:hypothetical protein